MFVNITRSSTLPKRSQRQPRIFRSMTILSKQWDRGFSVHVSSFTTGQQRANSHDLHVPTESRMMQHRKSRAFRSRGGQRGIIAPRYTCAICIYNASTLHVYVYPSLSRLASFIYFNQYEAASKIEQIKMYFVLRAWLVPWCLTCTILTSKAHMHPTQNPSFWPTIFHHKTPPGRTSGFWPGPATKNQSLSGAPPICRKVNGLLRGSDTGAVSTSDSFLV